MPLTALRVKNARPKKGKKFARLSDGNGLYLLVKESGAASWVLRVQVDGTRQDIGLGSLAREDISVDLPVERKKVLTLGEARKKAEIARQLAKAGENPHAYWKRKEDAEKPPRTFREVAVEVHQEMNPGWKDKTHKREWLSSLERHAFPTLGDKLVNDIDAAMIQETLLPIWLSKGETGRRVRQRIGAVLDHAFDKAERSTEAPMRAVNRLMKKIRQPRGSHFAAMPYKDLPNFLRALKAEEESVGRLALQFLILTAARPGEVRKAVWSEIDLDAAEWRIPPEKMKAGNLHIIPLVPPAIDILNRLKDLFGAKPADYVFPGNSALMSDATMNKALRTTNSGGFSVHGFRSTFRDWAADAGFNNDWAEAAIAHTIAGQEGKTVASYKRTTYYPHRKEILMPAWSAFVFSDGSNVVQLVRSA